VSYVESSEPAPHKGVNNPDIETVRIHLPRELGCIWAAAASASLNLLTIVHLLALTLETRRQEIPP
jgi:hypothetical protein